MGRAITVHITSGCWHPRWQSRLTVFAPLAASIITATCVIAPIISGQSLVLTVTLCPYRNTGPGRSAPTGMWKMESRMRAMPLTSPYNLKLSPSGHRRPQRFYFAHLGANHLTEANPPRPIHRLPATLPCVAVLPCSPSRRVAGPKATAERLTQPDKHPGTFATPSKARNP